MRPRESRERRELPRPAATRMRAAPPRPSCRGGLRVGAGRELERGLAREDARPDPSPAPQAVLKARPQDADTVDHRAAEADLARFFEIARRTGDLADAHAERMRLDEHLIVEDEILRIRCERKRLDHFAR